MIKMPVTYVDFEGVEHTEELRFHLKKSEVLDMMLITGTNTILELGEKLSGEMSTKEQRKEALELAKEVVLMAYGELDDNKVFRKSEKMREDFKDSLAYDEFYFSLFKDHNRMIDFFNGIAPRELIDSVKPELEKLREEADRQVAENQN